MLSVHQSLVLTDVSCCGLGIIILSFCKKSSYAIVPLTPISVTSIPNPFLWPFKSMHSCCTLAVDVPILNLGLARQHDQPAGVTAEEGLRS